MMPLTTPMKIGIGVAVAIVGIIIIMVVMSPKSSSGDNAAASSATTYTLPAGITNGMVVRCPSTGAISLVKDNQLCTYSWTSYVNAGKPVFTDTDCSVLASIPKGPDVL